MARQELIGDIDTVVRRLARLQEQPGIPALRGVLVGRDALAAFPDDGAHVREQVVPHRILAEDIPCLLLLPVEGLHIARDGFFQIENTPHGVGDPAQAAAV